MAAAKLSSSAATRFPSSEKACVVAKNPSVPSVTYPPVASKASAISIVVSTPAESSCAASCTAWKASMAL